MKIGDTVKQQGKGISFEIFAPKDAAAEGRLFETIGKLETLNPTFISVTCGAGGSSTKNTRQMVMRIKGETSLIPMPHLTCLDHNENELKDILEDYKSLGVENVLALRGDPPQGTAKFIPPRHGFRYAKGLVKLAASLNAFSIAVAVYPEGHLESPSLEMDMVYTRQKIDAGADFAITQMFFENRFFYDFLDRAEAAGIGIPIIPGIIPIMDIDRVKQFCQLCGATLPQSLVERMEEAETSKDVKKIGIEFTTKQCDDLLKNGIHHFHFFTLNQSSAVTQILNNLGLQPS